MYFSPILLNVGLPYKIGGFFQFWPPRPQFPLPPHILIIPITQNLGLPIPRILHTQIWDFPPPNPPNWAPPSPKIPGFGAPPSQPCGPEGLGVLPHLWFFVFFPFFPSQFSGSAPNTTRTRPASGSRRPRPRSGTGSAFFSTCGSTAGSITCCWTSTAPPKSSKPSMQVPQKTPGTPKIPLERRRGGLETPREISTNCSWCPQKQPQSSFQKYSR